MTGPPLAEDATWANHDAPYVVQGNLTLEGGLASANLTVSAGTTIKVQPGANIGVKTNADLTLTLTLDGAVDAQVTITSNVAVSSAGDWVEIDVYGDSVDALNVFTYADIMYGGSSVNGQLWIQSGGSVTLENTVFSEAGNSGCDVYLATGTPNGEVINNASTDTLCN